MHVSPSPLRALQHARTSPRRSSSSPCRRTSPALASAAQSLWRSMAGTETQMASSAIARAAAAAMSASPGGPARTTPQSRLPDADVIVRSALVVFARSMSTPGQPRRMPLGKASIHPGFQSIKAISSSAARHDRRHPPLPKNRVGTPGPLRKVVQSQAASVLGPHHAAWDQ
jgi:hypothetical protein